MQAGQPAAELLLARGVERAGLDPLEREEALAAAITSGTRTVPGSASQASAAASAAYSPAGASGRVLTNARRPSSSSTA